MEGNQNRRWVTRCSVKSKYVAAHQYFSVHYTCYFQIDFDYFYLDFFILIFHEQGHPIPGNFPN